MRCSLVNVGIGNEAIHHQVAVPLLLAYTTRSQCGANVHMSEDGAGIVDGLQCGHVGRGSSYCEVAMDGSLGGLCVVSLAAQTPSFISHRGAAP